MMTSISPMLNAWAVTPVRTNLYPFNRISAGRRLSKSRQRARLNRRARRIEKRLLAQEMDATLGGHRKTPVGAI